MTHMTRTHIALIFAILLALAPVLRAVDADTHDEHTGHEGHTHHDEHAEHEQQRNHEEARHEAPDAHAGHAHDDDHDAHAEHEDDDHDAHAEHEDDDHDAHAEHEDDVHAGHGHEEAGLLELSSAERRHAGIVIAQAGVDEVEQQLTMLGEVSLNEDRLIHVVPQVPGTAREVTATVGDEVVPGQVLAVLDSAELGEAKLDYLTKVNEIACCSIVVPRAKAIHDNTLRLLAFLEEEPSLEQLQGFNAKSVGENLTTLVGSYAERIAARQNFVREQGLRAKKITSEQEYLAAKTAYEKAVAEDKAARDSIAYTIKHALFEAEADLRAAHFAARTAEQRLRIMGLGKADVAKLEALLQPAEPCSDPTCVDCKAGATPEQRDQYFGNGFGRYTIRAPFAGTVVTRHITRGERVGEDSELFTIADMSTLWVDLKVHLRDLPEIEKGAPVTIRAEHSGRVLNGRVAMVSPVVDEATRTATARVVISNEDGAWRPGMFVVGQRRTISESATVLVPKSAVQTIEDEQVVFVPEGDAFAAVPVRVGRTVRDRVELLSGLRPGASYVAKGAFELKAKLVTSNLDPHAGHGH